MNGLVWAVLLGTLGCGTAGPGVAPLRVCADPNNLPFSNGRGEGFENRIAELLARELERPLEYVWWAQRRGFVRNALFADLCDVIPGIVTSMDSVLATRAYYRSSYVFVGRKGSLPRSFDDPVLRKLRIGVQIVGDDYANTPPAHEMARRGIVNVRGYRVAGDAPEKVVEAVANGEVDLAVAWGPMAGYFASRQAIPLFLSFIEPTAMPLTFDIGMGVRKQDVELKAKLDAVLDRKKAEIATILDDFEVPISPPNRLAEAHE